MEQHQNTSLFNLSIDPVTKAHLYETAKWARFLAIVGFVFMGLMVVGGAILAIYTASSVDSVENGFNVFAGFGIGMVFMYLVIAAIWFFPLLFLYRFATRLKTALNGNDQQALNTAVQNLKICFRYVGIITIIILGFYALAIIIGIIGAAAALS